MKLLKQITLYFQDEKSDKVYEVDLCQTSGDQYLVNFRYGRRGTQLREGTKTDTAVGLEKANSLFDGLVASKTKKGYSEDITIKTESADSSSIVGSQEDAAPYIPAINAPLAPARIQHILSALENAISPKQQSSDKSGQQYTSEEEKPSTLWGFVKNLTKGTSETPESSNPDRSSASNSKEQQKTRTLSRLVWRVGALRLEEALPLLLRVPVRDDFMEKYSLAWALGRCGQPEGVSKLLEIASTTPSVDALLVITREAKYALIDEGQKLAMINTLIQKLPVSFQSALEKENVNLLLEALNQLLKKQSTAYWAIADLYLIGQEKETARQAIVEWVKTAPIKGSGYFQGFRQLFKTAEFRDDGELYGLISYRMIHERSMVSQVQWGGVSIDNQWVDAKKEIEKPDSRIGFTEETKGYMHRRIWRTLREKGEVGDLAYAKMATGFLLAYTDADEGKSTKKTYYTYAQVNGRWQSLARTLDYTPFTLELAFSQILYANSPRYELAKGRRNWIAKSEAKVDVTQLREEAFPEIWDKVPEGLMHLLAESNSRAVHEFAAKAAKANHQVIQQLADVSFVKILLGKTYEATSKLGLDLAKAKYNKSAPDSELTLALLEAELEEARALGMEWIGHNPAIYFENMDFVVNMLFTPFDDVKIYLSEILPSRIFAQSEKIIAKSMARMLAVGKDYTVKEKAGLLNAGDLLSQEFSDTLYTLDFAFVRQLLNHAIPEVQVFGAKILLNHKTEIKNLPEDLILRLIEGESPELRAVGVELLGKLPDEALLQKEEFLRTLCISTHAEIRKTVQPIVLNLAKKDAGFAKEIGLNLAPQLLKKEDSEGRDVDLLKMLKGDLSPHLKGIKRRMILKLLYSSREAANDLGAHILMNYVGVEDLKMAQIVRLGSNELLSVREWCWNKYRENPTKIKEKAADAIRLMDAKWEDSQIFAFDYFNEITDPEFWTPEILVSLCDSVNPLVQQYGQQKIQEYFKTQNGEQYLLQLSQHPTPRLQAFATNYLEEYASDKPEHIAQLKHYFITVLSGVNKSRVAKKRIFDFLQKEGLKNQASAEVVAQILTRQSAGMVIKDKAKCIEIMRDLSKIHKTINMPITLKETKPYQQTMN